MIKYTKYILLGLLSMSSGVVLAKDLSTYYSDDGYLIVEDYGGDNKHYYLEFRNQGNFNFLLEYAEPLSAPSGFQQPAYFNQTANVVTIPSVNANQQYYSVDLRYKGGYSFTLVRADNIQPPTTNQPTNPPPNNGAVTTSTLVGKWQGTYQCNQRETNVDIDIDDALNAKFRLYASNSTLGAFDGYFYGSFVQNGTSIEFTPLKSAAGNNNIAVWSVKPSGSWVSLGFKATVDGQKLSMTGKFDEPICTGIKLTKVQQGNVRPQSQLDQIKASASTIFEQGKSNVNSAVNQLNTICENDHYLKACYWSYILLDFQAQPPITNQPTNPPQGSQSLDITYNQAAYEMFRCHNAGTASHECTDFWNTMARLELSCKNNNQEACNILNTVLRQNTELNNSVIGVH